MAERVEPVGGRRVRWERSTSWPRLYVTIPTAPLFLAVSRGRWQPRSLRIDDAAFDRKWALFGGPAAVVHQLMTPELRKQIDAVPSLEFIKVEGDQLELSAWGLRLDEPAMLALAEEIARRLEPLPAGNPEQLAALATRFGRGMKRLLIIGALVVIALIVVVVLLR